jgi:hypothetical protein
VGVGEEAPSARDVAALRDALLRYRDGWVASLDEPGRLKRRRPTRLVFLVALVVVAVQALVAMVRAPLSGVRVPDEVVRLERLVALYRRLAGTDPGTARAEVGRMIRQLLELDPRTRGEDDTPGAWPGLDRAGLEAGAGALAAYYLGGRRTDDALLAETQAIWTELEDAKERWEGRPGCFGIPGSRRPEGREDDQLKEEIASRYLDAWRRWLEREGLAGGAGPTDG